MKKIIILSQAPLTPQIKRNNLIDSFFSVGYKDLEFWDLSQYLHPGMSFVDELHEDYVKYVVSLVELKQLLISVDSSNTIFVLDFDISWSARHIFAELSKSGYFYVRIDMYANTYLYTSKIKQLQKLFSKNLKSIVKAKLGIIAYKIYAFIHHISPFKHYYSSSSIVSCTDKINHPDYEEFYFTKSKQICNFNYILFVDTCFGTHPDDIFIYKYKNIPRNKNYQESVNRFFSYLEHKYKIPVVIAAHPKSDYRNGEFGGRKIIKYETKNLVLFADKVILQLCNTISWVTLANKPVVFITTKDYDSLAHRRKRLRQLVKILGTKVYNIDSESYSGITFSMIEDKKRMSYINTYLTDESTCRKKNIDILKTSFESEIIK